MSDAAPLRDLGGCVFFRDVCVTRSAKKAILIDLRVPRPLASEHLPALVIPALRPESLTRLYYSRPETPGVSDFAVGDAVCVDLGLVETCVDPAPAGFRRRLRRIRRRTRVPRGEIRHSRRTHRRGASPRGTHRVPGSLHQVCAHVHGRASRRREIRDKVLACSAARRWWARTRFSWRKRGRDGGVHGLHEQNVGRQDEDGALRIPRRGRGDRLQDLDVVRGARGSGVRHDLRLRRVQRRLVASAKVLKKGGLFLSIANFAADPAANEACVFKNFLLKSDGEDLSELVATAEAGKLKVTFDSTVKMADVPAALTKSFKSEKRGKIVVAVAAE